MNNQIPVQPVQNGGAIAGQTPSIGQMKVDLFSLDKDMKSLMEKLKNDREALTRAFDQTRNAVRLLADLFSDKNAEAPAMDLSKFELAGIDIAQVLKAKIAEQASYIDKVANEHGVKSNLAEQFTHYDDRHTGAEAKNELLEDVETQLMSTIYNQINALREKTESNPDSADEKAAPPQTAQQPVNKDQFTIDSTAQK